MIKNLMSFLRGEEPVDGSCAAAEQQTRVAVAAVLVEVAMRDGVYHPAEKAEIEAMLTEAYGLDPDGAAALRVEGETAQAAAVDAHRFTRVIKDSIPPEERAALLERVWRVALADGERAGDESSFMRLLAGLLYVEDRENALARRRAEARSG